MVESGKVEGRKVISKTVGSRNIGSDDVVISNMTKFGAGATDRCQQGMNSPEKEEHTRRHKDNIGGIHEEVVFVVA